MPCSSNSRRGSDSRWPFTCSFFRNRSEPDHPTFTHLRICTFTHLHIYAFTNLLIYKVAPVSFLSLLLLLLGMLTACRKEADKTALANPELMHTSVRKLTAVIVHDIFSPPVASRSYAYANIAAYETLVPAYPSHQSLVGQLKGLGGLPRPQPGQQY